MSDQSTVVPAILNNLERLEKRLHHLVEENQNLQQAQQDLNRKNSELLHKLKEQESEIKRLKIAKTLVSSTEDNTAVKQKVNELVREIDKCIALLNK